MGLADNGAPDNWAAQVVARLPFDERMDVVLEWLGISLVAFVVLLILIFRWSRDRSSLKHASRQSLRRMYARGKITLAEYEQERQRRRQEK